MVANTHNSTPAIAYDAPTDANVRIGPAQAIIGKTLIGPHFEETPHSQMIPSFRIIRQERDFASNSLTTYFSGSRGHAGIREAMRRQ
jgi:hypothetical protein